MIVREELTINNKNFIKTYSDKGMMIERDGVQYSEAIDPIEFAEERVYVETDIPIENENATSVWNVDKWTEIEAPIEDEEGEIKI